MFARSLRTRVVPCAATATGTLARAPARAAGPGAGPMAFGPGVWAHPGPAGRLSGATA
ncbi:hypothetical protein GCM10023224_18930 [Streptomonospora halophila]|uniref:Uncharacterized protein n=1 Tax=Streptomonospora halophila TaxID=427369 RepID=A0ABP9GCY5_9ACTN